MAAQTVNVSEVVDFAEAVTPIDPLLLVDTDDPILVADGAGTSAVFQQPLVDTVSVAELLVVGKLGFSAKAISTTRVLLLFGTVMPNIPAFTNPASYTITNVNGVSVAVTSVQAFTSAVVLTLGGNLTSSSHYIAKVVGAVTMDGLSLAQEKAHFQWVESRKSLRIPLRDFSGEASGGLLGEPDGLVFFSPAFDQPAASSSVQVDEVSVCTKSYDTYTIPQPIDPPPLFTYAGTAPASSLNGAVLWGAFPRLVDARVEPTLKPSDTLGAYDDGPATAELSETWDPDFVSLLNNDAWKLFDNTAPPPRTFITANNLAPIPPGGSTTIPLQP